MSADDAGRASYQADVTRCPTYHTGQKRVTWEQLSEIARESWRRNSTPKAGPPVVDQHPDGEPKGQSRQTKGGGAPHSDQAEHSYQAEQDE